MNKTISMILITTYNLYVTCGAGWLPLSIYNSFYHKKIQDHSKRVSGYPFITGDTFRNMSDHICDETNLLFDPKSVQYGDIIFVSAQIDIITYFLNVVHPKIASPYILITHNEDTSLPGALDRYLDDSKLLCWFAQNIDRDHPKLIGIPIGFSNPVWGEGGKTSNYLEAMQDVPSLEMRQHKVYMNFDVATNPTKRRPMWDFFKDKSFVYAAKRVSYRQHLEDLKKFRFVISPPGNGVDCHRPWEAILMGCIPIMKRSTVDVLFEELPVLFVSDWQEITQDFLDRSYDLLRKKTFKKEKIFIDYWLGIIKSFQQEVRSKNVRN